MISPLVEQLAGSLKAALRAIGDHDRIVFLDYPDHLNAGDHFIFLGSIYYLSEVRGIQIGYLSSLVNFDPTAMVRSLEDAENPAIVLQGGGNLGDLWPDSQLFREQIIEMYPNLPIYILPQSIYFQSNEATLRAQKIFGAHSNLTIFAREQESYKIGRSLFANNKVLLCSDMAFFLGLAGLPSPGSATEHGGRSLYLCRKDKELDPGFKDTAQTLRMLEVENWFSYDWYYNGRGAVNIHRATPWNIPGALGLYREVWQRRMGNRALWQSRHQWTRTCSLGKLLGDDVLGKSLKFSMNVSGDCLFQLARTAVLATNHLHGHIGAALMGIPSVLTANTYHKNRSFHETWMANQSDYLFAARPEDLVKQISRINRQK